MTDAEPDKTPTLDDVARRAGVSKGTASNVFNRPKIVRAEVRARVLEAARAIGYRGPDPKGRMLSAGRANAIGVATMEPLSYFFQDPFARQMMTAITDACQRSGKGISLISAASEDDLAWTMQSALVDGFILFCLTGAERLIARSRERRLPFVALDYGKGYEGVSVIGIDNFGAARQLARHLVDLGHRRFAVLAMELSPAPVGTWRAGDPIEYAASRDRLAGYLEELRAAGVEAGDVPVEETDSTAATVGPALERLFSSASPPTAILAQSDRIALVAFQWLRERGLEVPRDVSVVGFDGIPEAAAANPPLTTIEQPIGEIGRRAVEAILDGAGEARHETVETRLILRGSTAPPPAGAVPSAGGVRRS